MAYLHIRQQDKVGLLIHDANAVHHLPAKCRTSHLQRIYALLEGVEPGTGSAFSELVSEVASFKRHRGVIVVCSDLEEDPAEIERALDELATREDDVFLFHVLDEAEVELPFSGATHLKDSETGELLSVDMPGLRQRHSEEVERFRAGWREKCRDWAIGYQPSTPA